MEDEGDDESTAENFKQVAREGDLSPTTSAKGVALMEPFQKKGLIERYKRKLNMETAYTNINGQIWLFFDAVVEWELVKDTEQQETVRVFHHDLGQHMMMTFVYAKCSSMERLDLWDHLYYLASDMELPWLVGGNFNMLLHEDEKIGGLPVHPLEYENFAFCVNSCGLFEQGYKGSPFTWWNGRSNAECIFKRLDRIFVNLPFQNMLPTIEVEHLIRTGSDHAPLLMTCGVQTTKFVKPFRFLNFWTKHATFMDVVRQNWEADFIGDPFLMFKQNIKRVKAALSKWNRETFGDIFKQLAILEDIVRLKEMLKKLQLKRIKSGSGVWIEDQAQLATVAVDFYQKQFTNEGDASKFPLLNNVPSMVTMDQNLELNRLPTIEEVRAAIFELSEESASGPDGFTGLFYQTCWDVIGVDIHNMGLHFYGEAALPKSITHTNLVSLNKLFEDKSFVGFGMPKWSDSLNHLAYADDMIIFAYAHPPSLSKIMAVLRNYEKISGSWSYYRICKRRKDYYEELIKKVKAKLHSWKGKLLSFGGKEEGRSRHWASWKNLCLPKEEGEICFRSLNDVSRALFAKLWWRFRTTKSLWSNFMWNKYCKKEPPTVVRFRGGSHVWRQMLNAREEVEHEIVWELKTFPYDHVLPEDFPINEGLQEVAELWQGETWYDQLLDQTFNEEIAEHIRLNVHYEGSEGYWDKPYWMPTPSGKFSVSSAWQIIRHRADPNQEFKLMWIKGFPFKISFFLWRLWRKKITTDDMWRRQGQMLPCHGWYKCNTDGASKGNHGPSSLGFCVRDDEGDVVYASAVDLGVTTHVVAEAKAILQGLEYCTSKFHSFSKLPSARRRLINLDKSQSPNLRIRIAKRRTPD
ncbi:uncharacterized protein [Nicotiana tomentosiformis]|uniref:uncharacterized protein n=1 Tax=Nicotiana tomentosiformis TaxID=4098 RepID=UPI00388CC70E